MLSWSWTLDYKPRGRVKRTGTTEIRRQGGRGARRRGEGKREEGRRGTRRDRVGGWSEGGHAKDARRAPEGEWKERQTFLVPIPVFCPRSLFAQGVRDRTHGATETERETQRHW